MGARFDCFKLGPGQQFVRGDQSFTHLACLFGDDLHSLHHLVGMSQKKVQIELAGGIQDLDRLLEMASFARIRASLPAGGEIKQEFGRSGRLSHLVPQFLLPLLSSNP